MALADLPLMQDGDMSLVGSFTIDDQVNGYFSYGGHGMGFDPAGNGGAGSLWMAGLDQAAKLGEISIPSLGGVADILTIPATPPNLGVLDRIGGSFVYNGQLIVAGLTWYSGNNPGVSHWRSPDKTIANLIGPVNVGGVQNAAFYAGYIQHLPAAWQAEFGGPCVTGQGSISIIDRASWGPALYVFDPDDIGSVTPVPAQPLMYYNETHPLHAGPYEIPTTLWNKTAVYGGVFFPTGTRSVCYVYAIGVGPQCYGTGQNTNPAQQCEEISPDIHQTYDPLSSDQGYHAYPYQHRLIAFDALQLLASKAGEIQPWEVQPYANWELPGMETVNLATCCYGGMAYDPVLRRTYINRGTGFYNFGSVPRIYAWDHVPFDGEEPPPQGGAGGPIVPRIVPFL